MRITESIARRIGTHGGGALIFDYGARGRKAALLINTYAEVDAVAGADHAPANSLQVTIAPPFEFSPLVADTRAPSRP
jgi:hypothetical protein